MRLVLVFALLCLSFLAQATPTPTLTTTPTPVPGTEHSEIFTVTGNDSKDFANMPELKGATTVSALFLDLDGKLVTVMADGYQIALTRGKSYRFNGLNRFSRVSWKAGKAKLQLTVLWWTDAP